MGEVLRHRGGPGAAGQRPAATAEPRLRGAGVHFPAPRRDRAEAPQVYVVSFVRLHERGFGIPVSKFMRALCDHYGAELHNFSPNAISQAAVFVAVCEGYLGIEVHWDLWIHLFRGELFVESGRGQPRRFARAGGTSKSTAR